MANTNMTFTNINDLMDFITSTKEFDGWETPICRVSASNGAGFGLNYETKINDPSANNRHYIPFQEIKNEFVSWCKRNQYLSLNVEIKLKFPNDLKKVIDPQDYYEAFYIDFFSDEISTFASPTFVEKTKKLNDNPVKSWVIYMTNLYNAWSNDKANNN